MKESIELNQGEIKIELNATSKGKITFKDLGLTDDDLVMESGLLRLVFEIKEISANHFFKMPTIEVAYKEEVGETHWQCDYNNETILDKMDHHGHSTVILLSRKKLDELEHRHENTLVLHAEFPQKVHLKAADSYINIFN